MGLSLIVATTLKGVIGDKGKIPWHLPADLKRFKKLTTGHHVIMGRKTFESLPKLLENRTHVVITRQGGFTAPEGVIVVYTVEDALRAVEGDTEPFVIGGAETYDLFLPYVTKAYVTYVSSACDGDTVWGLPFHQRGNWQPIACEATLNYLDNGESSAMVTYVPEKDGSTYVTKGTTVIDYKGACKAIKSPEEDAFAIGVVLGAIISLGMGYLSYIAVYLFFS